MDILTLIGFVADMGTYTIDCRGMFGSREFLSAPKTLESSGATFSDEHRGLKEEICLVIIIHECRCSQELAQFSFHASPFGRVFGEGILKE